MKISLFIQIFITMRGWMAHEEDQTFERKPQAPSKKNLLNNSLVQTKVDHPPKVVGLNDVESNLERMKKELNFPAEFHDYSSKEYWNTRYTHEEGKHYEWLQPYENLRPHIMKIMQSKMQNSTTLYIGCGNSRLGEQMVADGFSGVVCIDFSDVLIKDLTQRYHQYSTTKLSYECMDVTEKLEFSNQTVDFIIDKGLIDAVLCGEDFFEKVPKLLSECWRVLKPRGYLMMLSQGHPDTRVIYLKTKNTPFALNIQELPKIPIPQFAQLDDLQCHYLYILQKP